MFRFGDVVLFIRKVNWYEHLDILLQEILDIDLV